MKLGWPKFRLPRFGWPKRGWPKLRWPGWRKAASWSLISAIWLAVLVLAVAGYFAYSLPDVGRLAAETRRPSIEFLANDGSTLATYGQVYGEPVQARELPPYLPQAVLVTEDRRFYEHVGVDLWGIARAAWVNLRAGGVVQGGSTITQQLAKNLFLTNERTLKRKIQEVMLALWLEQRFSKDQILTLYLNRVYLGAGTYGVDAAARHYFDKPAQAVSLYEAALLAGLLKAPSRYNPANNPDLADTRADVVLSAMVDAGYIEREMAREASQDKAVRPVTAGAGGRYFTDWAMQRVEEYIGVPNQDLVVETTLDPNLQGVAEDTLVRELQGAGAELNVGQGALVAMTPEGAVLALVGGAGYGESQFNRATQALRQPGSAFKLFVYLAGIEQGLEPDDRFLDAPVTLGDWSPGNYDDRYYGEVTLREAFARSLNSVAVRVTQEIGYERVISAARRLGITTDMQPDASIALGTSEVTLVELTGAYATFANNGMGVLPHALREIRSRDGAVLWQRRGGGPGRVVAPDALGRMTDLMRANVAWGTGEAAKPGQRPAAGKTGTSQDFRDAWFVGFTAQLVTGVWLGNDDGTPMKGVTGGKLPARVWRRFTQRALQGVPSRPLPGAGVEIAEDSPNLGKFIVRVLENLGGEDDSSKAPSPEPTPAQDSGHKVRGVGN
ncbi:MAG: PBP1A family penicillin-binding protein [Rhodovibrionaceae bacterium]|nr:PBP1A family penicillin-binding protein [Rhodovibrionaceae bacterium]